MKRFSFTNLTTLVPVLAGLIFLSSCSGPSFLQRRYTPGNYVAAKSHLPVSLKNVPEKTDKLNTDGSLVLKDSLINKDTASCKETACVTKPETRKNRNPERKLAPTSLSKTEPRKQSGELALANADAQVVVPKLMIHPDTRGLSGKGKPEPTNADNMGWMAFGFSTAGVILIYIAAFLALISNPATWLVYLFFGLSACIFALVIGIIAWAKSKRETGHALPFAKAAVIMSAIGIGFVIVVAVLVAFLCFLFAASGGVI